MMSPVLTRIRVRPWTLWVQQGHSILATNLQGEVNAENAHGFFERDTRYLSRYAWTANGMPLEPVVVQPVTHHTLMGYYRVQGSEELPANALEVQIIKRVGRGFHEDILVQNNTEHNVACVLQLAVEADFIDVMEITRGKREQWGELTQQWEPEKQRLHFDYRIEDLHHGLNLCFKGDSPRWEPDHGLAWQLTLSPREAWHLCVIVEPIFCRELLTPVYGCYQAGPLLHERDIQQAEWLRTATQVTCPNLALQRAYDSAKADLISMRLWEEDSGDGSWIPAAGLPLYIGVFGRDILTASWQAGLMGPEMMTGAVRTLGKYQATEDNPWRDEQPGKLIHEARLGPLSLLERIPQRSYYGSTTSTPLYFIVLSELYHWTGDRRLLEENLPVMDKAMDWIDHYGDLDGDGFYEYQKLSPQGLKNQGWKDSDEGIIYADGRIVPNPIATCEEQGWVYDAKIRAAMMYTALKDFRRAETLLQEAHALKTKFNQAFWMPEENFFALALDPDKKQVTSITSNPGHCLATGIVDEEKAGPMIGRLFSPDLFSGWGIRTLSDRHPGYDPYGYHLGTVWPVENGTFCMGFVRYGFPQHAQLLAKTMIEASEYFEYGRLPEVMGGHPRDTQHPIPSIYPQSNMPQAWSSSIFPIMLQALLGLYPFAPFNLLLLDPQLPVWLPELTLHRLRVGNAEVSLHFWRDDEGKTHYRVLSKTGRLRILPHVMNIHRFHELMQLGEAKLAMG